MFEFVMYKMIAILISSFYGFQSKNE